MRRSDWDQDILEHAAGERGLHRLVERGQWVRLRYERFDIESTVGDRGNRLRVAIRPQVAAVDVQLFGIPDDRPVDRHRFVEDAELDEGAKLADHLQA